MSKRTNLTSPASAGAGKKPSLEAVVGKLPSLPPPFFFLSLQNASPSLSKLLYRRSHMICSPR